MRDKTEKTPGIQQTPTPVNAAAAPSLRAGQVSQETAFIAADELKKRFKTGAIAQADDFAALIDMADAGVRATGQAPDQVATSGGVCLDTEGRLKLDLPVFDFPATDQNFVPIKVNSKTNEIVLPISQEIEHTDAGLTLNVGAGLTCDAQGVAIGEGLGISVDESGVAVKCGAGLEVSDQGVCVGLADDAGMQFDDQGRLCIKPGEGIEINGDVVQIKGGLGTKFDAEGALCINTGAGLAADEEGVSVISGLAIAVTGEGISVRRGNGISLNENNGLQVELGGGLRFSEDDDAKIELIAEDCSENVSTFNCAVRVEDGVPSIAISGGLNYTLSGLSVGAGKGIVVNSNGVSVAANAGVLRGTTAFFDCKRRPVPDGWEVVNTEGSDETYNLIKKT